MTKSAILKKIGFIIIELRDQYDLAQFNRENINDIDLELFVANAHFLIDHIEILRKLNNQEVKSFRERPDTIGEPKYFEPVVKTILAPEAAQPQLDFPKDDNINDRQIEQHFAEPFKEEPTEEPIIRHELLLDADAYMDTDEVVADDGWATEEEMEVEIAHEEPFKLEEEPYHQPEVEEPIAEAYNEAVIIEPETGYVQTPAIIDEADEQPRITINQILSAQIASSSSYSALQPISDLKSAITLNDKLLYVRDLFNGYSMAYGEAIEILNRFSQFDEADSFLKLNYYTKNNWEAKQATTDRFYELLHRRFPA
jgi:hypothetical protein